MDVAHLVAIFQRRWGGDLVQSQGVSGTTRARGPLSRRDRYVTVAIHLSVEHFSMELTQLIRAARDGDSTASDRLFGLVYDDLKRLAKWQLKGGGGATSLVHEAYLKLAKPAALDLNDRQHFFAVAARAMRQIRINQVRESVAAKRGGGAAVVTLGAADSAAIDADSAELLALDQALDLLAAADSRLAQLVELRFFGGMTLEEAGAATGLSTRTLKRDWRRARAFLHDSINTIT